METTEVYAIAREVRAEVGLSWTWPEVWAEAVRRYNAREELS